MKRSQAAVTDATKRALRLFGDHLGGNMSNKEVYIRVCYWMFAGIGTRACRGHGRSYLLRIPVA